MSALSLPLCMRIYVCERKKQNSYKFLYDAIALNQNVEFWNIDFPLKIGIKSIMSWTCVFTLVCFSAYSLPPVRFSIPEHSSALQPVSTSYLRPLRGTIQQQSQSKQPTASPLTLCHVKPHTPLSADLRTRHKTLFAPFVSTLPQP